MSKSRNKNGSELEYFRGRVKNLERENRRLKRQLKHFERKNYHFENVIEEASDDVRERPNKCNECGKGTLIVYDFKHLVVTTCDICDYQTKYKPRRKT
jgi:predicted RNase H-like nuclease (RuvC/YqgF family)